MKNMIWKELRENFKWALLALLGMLLAQFYVLSSKGSSPDNYNGLTLCSGSFLLVTSFGYAAVGVALGILQILPELKRDRWASLLHRPVSRETIFSGKVLAGLILYAFATVLPLLVSATYVSWPGQFAAPFVPRMVLPAASDVALGLCFYFAALLLCLHRGRWWGSRGAILLSIVPVFLLHSTLFGMWLLPLLAAIVFFSASLGAMLSNGRPQQQSKPGRVSLILILLSGSYAAVTIVLFGVLWIFAQTQKTEFSAQTEFVIAKDGNIFLTRQQKDGSIVVEDLKGGVVTDERYLGNNRYQQMLQLNFLAFNLKKGPALQNGYIRKIPRNMGNYFQAANRDYDSSEQWYLLRRENYFIGYDKLSKRCVGIFDVDGFRPPGVLPNPFPLRPLTSSWYDRNAKFYWVGTQLYRISFSDRAMSPFFRTDGESILAAQALANYFSPQKPANVAVALESGIRIFDDKGKPIFAFPYHKGIDAETALSIGSNETLNRYYVLYSPYFWSSSMKEKRDPTVLDVLDGQGKLLESHEIPSPEIMPVEKGWFAFLAEVSASPFPAILSKGYEAMFPPLGFDDYETGLSLSFGLKDDSWRNLLPAAFFLALATFFWSRRTGFGFGEAAGWAVFVLCFGLAGGIAFLLAAHWPQRVRCPQCGGMRPVEAATCPACSREWPMPERDGTEIFGEKLSAEG